MRAFRHDVATTADYFTRRWPGRGATATRLPVPITVLAGTDDPLTPQPEKRFRSWRRFSADVDLVLVENGQHYFHQQQAAAVAAAITERTSTRAARKEMVS